MKMLLIKSFGKIYFNKKEKLTFGVNRQSMIKIQLQALGTGLANSLMFFIHAAAFGYGSVLVGNGEMKAPHVFR
jgi:hypothetical protein